MRSIDQKYFEICDSLVHARGIILDTLEMYYGQTRDWQFVRNRILTALGQKGLEGRLNSLLSSESHEKEQVNLGVKNV